MKIAVNLRLLIPGKLEGIGRFSLEIINRLIEEMPDAEFHLLFDRKPPKEFPFPEGVKKVHIPPQARHPVLYNIWFNIMVPRYLRRKKIDLFLSPDGYLCQGLRIPQIPVIHDLNFEHRPEDLPPTALKYYKKNFPVFARTAKRIATVSEFSKQDLQKTYGISAKRIDLVPNAAKEIFTPSKNKAPHREAFANGNPYVLSVGSIHPRKNLEVLIKAFDLLNSAPGFSHDLVLVGEEMWKDELGELKNLSQKVRGKIHFTGRIPDAELVKAYQGADLYVFPSFFEGFGIPVLEAMGSGVPVLASNRTSLPEVGGDAARYFNPEQPEQLSEEIHLVLNSPEIQKEMIEKGLKQARKYSWDISAKAMKESIIKALS